MIQARDGVQELKVAFSGRGSSRGDQEHYLKLYSDLLTIMASEMEEQEVGVDHSFCSLLCQVTRLQGELAEMLEQQMGGAGGGGQQ